MSWDGLRTRVDLVNVAIQIQVKVLSTTREAARFVGFKQLTPDPWLDAEHRYPVALMFRARDQRH